MQPDLAGNDYILSRQLKPEARTDIVELLKKALVKPTAMIDISDGLASEIIHICQDSNLGCQVYEEKIPIDAATALMADTFNVSPLTWALNGGEDYELLFTVKQEDYNKLSHLKDIHVIGHMTENNEGMNLITQSGTIIPLNAQGWDAFLKRSIGKDEKG